MTTVRTKISLASLQAPGLLWQSRYPPHPLQLLSGAHPLRSAPLRHKGWAFCARTPSEPSSKPYILRTLPALRTVLSLWGAPELAHSKVDASQDKREKDFFGCQSVLTLCKVCLETEEAIHRPELGCALFWLWWHNGAGVWEWSTLRSDGKPDPGAFWIWIQPGGQWLGEEVPPE